MSRQEKSGWAALNAIAYIRPTRWSIIFFVAVLTVAGAVVAGTALGLVDKQAAIIAIRLLGFALLAGYLVIRRRQHRKK